MIPTLFDSGISVILYVLLVFTVGTGIWQFVKFRFLLKEGEEFRFRSIVPIGAASSVFGFIGMFNQYRLVFNDIEAAGDISPSIVASGMQTVWGYPILGLLVLAISFIFKYVNQTEVTVHKEAR